MKQRPVGGGAYVGLQILTLSRVPLALVFGWSLLGSQHPLDTPSLVMVLTVLGAMELTDLLDGLLARRYRLASWLGEALDPLADSLSRSLVYFFLSLQGAVWGVVPLILLMRDVVVAYCRMAALSRGGAIASNISGKVKAVVQGLGAFAAILLLAQLPEGVGSHTGVLSGVVVVVTVGSSVQYVVRALRPHLEGELPSGSKNQDNQ